MIKINKLNPDIFYEIFALAVHSSLSPRATALVISHVCRYWRESALGWPTLWAFINLNESSKCVDLFVQRSQNAPLALSWTTSDAPGFDLAPEFDQGPSKSYLMSNANSILSRLDSLNIFTSYSNFAQFLRAIQESELSLLQLRRIDIYLFNGEQNNPVPPLSLHVLYNDRLREVAFEGMDLPWLELPHNNLTSLALNTRINPPGLSQLLVFLSNCPSLRALVLDFQDDNDHETQATFTTTNKLTLNLTELKLGAWGSSSYDFLQEFSGCIRISGTLNTFDLYHVRDRPAPEESEFRLVRWPIPPEIFSHFSGFQYFNIHYDEPEGWLNLCGHTSASDHADKSPTLSCPFVIDCTASEPAPVLELIHAMPQIRHLVLGADAWVIFALWSDHDIPSAFPCLHTLEVTEFGTDELNSLPKSLQIKKLILKSCAMSAEVLFDVVSSMGVQVLELIVGGIDGDGDMDDDDVCALRERGVDVVWKYSGESTVRPVAA